MKITLPDFLRERWAVRPSHFIWLVTLLNVAFFHGPLWRYLSAQQLFSDGSGLGVVLVIVGLLLVLSWGVLGTLSLLSTRLLWPVVTLWMTANAIALYAMNTYQVVLDKAMMGNVWSTDRKESIELFHPEIFLYLGTALALLWLFRRKMQWRDESRWRRVAHLMLASFMGLGTVYAHSSSWLWVDKHAKVIGGLMLPWSYTLNSARFWLEQRESERELLPLPALSWMSYGVHSSMPITVVLVIGESARAQNFSLYGYPRETNPALAQRPLLVLPGAQACATYTRRSLECLLSHDPGAARLTHQTLPDYLAASGQVDVVWRSRNWGEPRLRHVQPLRGAELRAHCVESGCTEPDQDESMLAGLDRVMAQSSQALQLIVLHQSGSHGPAYNTKYPSQYARFTPVCESVDLKKCTQAALVNAYDNTIVYTDQFLDRLISILARQTARRTLLIYVSDHGESLGEGGWYLHGAPELVAPREQKDIPFLLWLSPTFADSLRPNPAVPALPRSRPTMAPAAHAGPYGHGHVFHTVLGALGARSEVYRTDLDVLTPWRSH